MLAHNGQDRFQRVLDADTEAYGSIKGFRGKSGGVEPWKSDPKSIQVVQDACIVTGRECLGVCSRSGKLVPRRTNKMV